MVQYEKENNNNKETKKQLNVALRGKNPKL